MTAVAPSESGKIEILELNALDRCDGCGAQAHRIVELQSELQLMFCQHHFREHRDSLEAIGANILV